MMLRVGSAFVLGLLLLGACNEPPIPSEDGGGGGSSSGADPSSGTTGLSGTGMLPGDSSSGSSSGTTESPPLDESGGDFLAPPDATHPDYQCDPVAQDCPMGTKCVWYVEPALGSTQRRDAARCIPVAGDVAPFEPCTLPTGIGPEITDDCGAESFCLEVYGTADHGFCAPFVDFENGLYSCDAYPGTNVAIENGSDFPAACLHHDCQPLVPGSCPDGMQCTFYPAFLYGANMCWHVPPAAELPLGVECDYGECGEGELCAPAEWVPGCTGERCCTQWCDLNAPACDDPAAVCEFVPVWNIDEDPDFAWLGACVVPGSLG